MVANQAWGLTVRLRPQPPRVLSLRRLLSLREEPGDETNPDRCSMAASTTLETNKDQVSWKNIILEMIEFGKMQLRKLEIVKFGRDQD